MSHEDEPSVDEPPADEPTIVAHRGFGGRYPENTVGGIHAAAIGPGRTELIEIDVVPTADGTVVCFHDDRLDDEGDSRGVTDGTGLVWETPTDEVLSAEVLDSGETVPRLVDVLEAVPTDVGFNVELKNPGTTDIRFAEVLNEDDLDAQRAYWDPFVESVLSILADFDHEFLISSFCEAALASTRDADPSLPLGVLCLFSAEDGLTIADRYDTEAVHPPWNLVAGTPFYGDAGPFGMAPSTDVDLVARAHEAGRDVNVWTVDTWYRADRLRDAGVDGLIADYPCLEAGLPTQ